MGLQRRSHLQWGKPPKQKEELKQKKNQQKEKKNQTSREDGMEEGSKGGKGDNGVRVRKSREGSMNNDREERKECGQRAFSSAFSRRHNR